MNRDKDDTTFQTMQYSLRNKGTIGRNFNEPTGLEYQFKRVKPANSRKRPNERIDTQITGVAIEHNHR